MDVEKVREIAELARIRVSDEEAERLAKEFEEVLEMFGRLDEVECEGGEVLPVEVVPELRDDVESGKRREEREIRGPRTVE